MSYPRNLLPKLLEQLFTTRSLLFLGCSLLTDRTLLFMRRVQQLHGAPATHFAILERPEHETAFAERRDAIALLGIEAIWYPAGRHEHVGEILDRILTPYDRGRRRLPPKRQDSPSNAIMCIDFGTSTSMASLWTPRGRTAVRFPSSGRRSFPSVLRFFSNLEYEAGVEFMGKPHPGEVVVRNIKRLLLTDEPIRVGPAELSPVTVVSLLLRSIRCELEDWAGTSISRFLAATPANFGPTENHRLEKAFELAGYPLMRLVGEPCAAALCLAEWTSPEDELNVLVVDLGGGTFDVSVVELVAQVSEVRAVGGLRDLGGMDFDSRLMDHVRAQLLQTLGLHMLPAEYETILRHECERTKIYIGLADTATIVLPALETADGRMLDFRLEITAADCARLWGDLVRRIDACIEDVSRSFNGEIGAVMLAGLGARVSPVARLLVDKYGAHRIIRDFQEDAVIHGLAVQSGILSGYYQDHVLVDTAYANIYVSCEPVSAGHGHSEPWRRRVLAKNTTIPTRMSRHVINDGRAFQHDLRIHVFSCTDDIGLDGPTLRDRLVTLELAELGEPTRVGITIDIDSNRTSVLSLVRFPDGGSVRVQLNNPYATVWFARPVLRADASKSIRIILPRDRSDEQQWGLWDLDEADLRGESFRGLNLRFVSFEGADLRGADMRSCNLRLVTLEKADLRDADLREADLRGANLEGASLSTCRVEGTLYDADTKFPGDFDPRQRSMIDVSLLTTDQP